MLNKFLTLSSRIKQKLSNIQNSVQRARKAWNLVNKEEDSLYLDSVALNLHDFYSGLERIFESIAENIDEVKPEGSYWHQDILRQMTIEIPTVRPAVISQDLEERLDEYRAFCHIVRNVYAYNFKIERIKTLIDNIEGVFDELNKELSAFCGFLEKQF